MTDLCKELWSVGLTFGTARTSFCSYIPISASSTDTHQGPPRIWSREEAPFWETHRTGPSLYVTKADIQITKNIWKGEVTERKLLIDLILGCLTNVWKGQCPGLLVNWICFTFKIVVCLFLITNHLETKEHRKNIFFKVQLHHVDFQKKNKFGLEFLFLF